MIRRFLSWLIHNNPLHESEFWCSTCHPTASVPAIMHNAAGPCEANYHRAMPDGSRCRCGQVRQSAPTDGAS